MHLCPECIEANKERGQEFHPIAKSLANYGLLPGDCDDCGKEGKFPCGTLAVPPENCCGFMKARAQDALRRAKNEGY